jgi:phenylalanyl-tRNA synthetase alpha chain
MIVRGIQRTPTILKRGYSFAGLSRSIEEMTHIRGQSFEKDSMTNVTASILKRANTNELLQERDHPLAIVKEKIFNYFKGLNFVCKDVLNPIVTVKQNFDELGFPMDHVGRTLNDSYYINREWMLRTHMTANEREQLKAGLTKFIIAGDVYRRDEIDATHYPVFHQLEGVFVFDPNDPQVAGERTTPENVIVELSKEMQFEHSTEQVVLSLNHLQKTLDGLLKHLFGKETKIKWQSCYFPFTQPSLEVEIFHKGRWIEVLGSGILQSNFLRGSGISSNQMAWAFGLGIERIAMILYEIPDIRLFWSSDTRFTSQFSVEKCKENDVIFKPFSKYPHIARDLSFWLCGNDESSFESNSLFEIVRSHAGDIVECVELVQEAPPFTYAHIVSVDRYFP